MTDQASDPINQYDVLTQPKTRDEVIEWLAATMRGVLTRSSSNVMHYNDLAPGTKLIYRAGARALWPVIAAFVGTWMREQWDICGGDAQEAMIARWRVEMIDEDRPITISRATTGDLITAADDKITRG